jgi:uncharacterized protein YecA (UPF0149 family)
MILAEEQDLIALGKAQLRQFLTTGDYEELLPERKGNYKYMRKRRITPVFRIPKTGRNDKCPCGSGKKYKHCCLR